MCRQQMKDKEVGVYICVYTYIDICTYIYTCIHTHTHIYTPEPTQSYKKGEILPFGRVSMDMEDIMQSEINVTKKDKYHMKSLICAT